MKNFSRNIFALIFTLSSLTLSACSVRAKVVCHFSATETCPNPNQNCYGELSQI
ncbi:MAG: hypothetical protein PUB15_04115 [Ruminobacter sp.]|nr:hypothetical protein [Ruminobacter sp.]